LDILLPVVTQVELSLGHLSSYASELEELKLDLGGYLRENQSSEIAGELNRIAKCDKGHLYLR
jgi:hypothetical protein